MKGKQNKISNQKWVKYEKAFPQRCTDGEEARGKMLSIVFQSRHTCQNSCRRNWSQYQTPTRMQRQSTLLIKRYIRPRKAWQFLIKLNTGYHMTQKVYFWALAHRNKKGHVYRSTYEISITSIYNSIKLEANLILSHILKGKMNVAQAVGWSSTRRETKD